MPHLGHRNLASHRPQTSPSWKGTEGPQGWEPVRIPAAGGVCLSGLLGYPPQLKNADLQAVILVHGFAAEKTENGLFSEIGDLLLRSGYAVLMYDWRGLGESDGDFSRTTIGTHSSDFDNVVKWLDKTCGLESTRFCAIGFSLGAALVVSALKNGLKLGAASFWSPAVRPRLSMWPRYNTPALRAELRANGFVIKPETDVELGRQILHSLRDTDLGLDAFSIGLPLLVCHGTDDSRIPVEHSRKVFAGSRNESAIFAEFPGASHSFRPAPMQRPILFDLFTRWLSDENFRAPRRCLGMSPGAQPPRGVEPSETQKAQAVYV